MLSRGRRLSAALIVLALGVGRPVLCAGWMPTPEARMACCEASETCPMHQPDGAPHGHSSHDLTQSQADRCCAASDNPDSTPSSPVFVLSMTVQDHSPSTMLLVTWKPARDAWRTAVPLPGAPIARHVLLSVFLV